SHIGCTPSPRMEIESTQRRTFGGIAVLERACIDRLPDSPAPCIIRDALAPALRDGAHIAAFDYTGSWHDLGTPTRLFNALEAHGIHPSDGRFPEEVCRPLQEPVLLGDGRRSQRFVPSKTTPS